MTYFTIPISARSEEERAERIADNESRGFEVVDTFERVTDAISWENSGYRVGNKAVFRHAGGETHTSYCAIMRRDNTEYLKQKKMAQ